MTGQSRIRYAEQTDIERLMRLDRWPKREDWVHKITAREVVVAHAGDDIVGHLRFTVLWTTVPFVGLIWVEPPWRGRGISRRLLAFLTSELRGRGYVALLSSSQTDEPEPQRWHRHMGFHTNGVIENIAEEGVGEVVFRMMLDR